MISIRGIIMQKNVSKERKSDGNNNILPFIPEGDFYFTKGVEAFRKQKFDIALKWLQKAVEQEPEVPLYLCQLSIVYTEFGEYHEANRLLDEVLRITEDNYIDCYYLLANNYAYLGQLQDAKKHALSYLDNEPEGDFSEEVSQLLELIDVDGEEEMSIDKEDELLTYQEALSHHMEHLEWGKALSYIEEMMTEFPEHKVYRHDYTQVLFNSGFPEKAIQIELDLLEEEPSSIVSRSNLAIFYYAHNKMEECQKYVQGIRNVYPVQEQQKLRIAITLAIIGWYQEANNRFRCLVKGVVKNHPSYYRWYSTALNQAGDPARALDVWREGCRRHPKLTREKDDDGRE